MGKKTEPKSTGTSGEDGKPIRGGGARGGRAPLTPVTPEVKKATEKKTDMQIILEKLGKLDKIDESITAQEFTVSQIKDKLQKIEEKCEKTNEDSKQVREESAGVKTQVRIHGARLSEIEDRIEQLERERRRNVLLIEGVKEKEREIVKEVVNKAFEDLQVGFDSGVCVSVFRRGRFQNGDAENGKGRDRPRPRPIVVIFQRQQDKSEIFRNLKRLKGKEEWNMIFFNDDLTETQENEQRDLRALAAFARDLGHESVVKAGLLFFDTTNYTDCHRVFLWYVPRLSAFSRTRRWFSKARIHRCPTLTHVT